MKKGDLTVFFYVGTSKNHVQLQSLISATTEMSPDTVFLGGSNPHDALLVLEATKSDHRKVLITLCDKMKQVAGKTNVPIVSLGAPPANIRMNRAYYPSSPKHLPDILRMISREITAA